MNHSQLDLKILSALQKQAKLSMQDLANETGSSPTQCWRRLKLLEESNVITGYQAQLNVKALGLEATAFVQVALSGHDPTSIERFLAIVEAEDQVVECASITGEYDFMLLVHAQGAEALESFIMRKLLNSGAVERTQSFFALRQTKSRGPLPLSHLNP